MGAKVGRSVSNFGRICNSRGVKYVPKAPKGGYAAFNGILGGGRPISIHTLVHVLHNDPLLLWRRPGDQVDHGDRNRENNDRTNLSWATRAEQRKNQKPHVHNGHNCVPVTLVKDGQRLFYASCKLAAEAHGFDRGAIARQKTAKGYTIIKHDGEPLPGETWKVHSTGLKVSDLGRVQTEMYGARMYEPAPWAKGWKYVRVPSTSRRPNVGTVVLEAFGYPMPPGCTVNHKNHDRGDNRLENLEWATAAEQNAHKRKPQGRADLAHSNDLEGEVWRPIVVEDWSPGGKYDIPGLR